MASFASVITAAPRDFLRTSHLHSTQAQRYFLPRKAKKNRQIENAPAGYRGYEGYEGYEYYEGYKGYEGS